MDFFTQFLNEYALQEERVSATKKEPSHQCRFQTESDGIRSCVICGVIQDYEECPCDLYNPKVLNQVIYEGMKDLGIFYTPSLKEQVQQMIDQNVQHVPRAGVIMPYIWDAVDRISNVKTTLHVKGKTPIKMVAVITLKAVQHLCVPKEDVMKLLGLRGVNLIPAQSALEQNISSGMLSSPKEDPFIQYIRSLPFEITQCLKAKANEVYESYEQTNQWLGNSEEVRFRVAAIAFAIKAQGLTDSRNDIKKLTEMFSKIIPCQDKQQLQRLIKKYTKNFNMFAE